MNGRVGIGVIGTGFARKVQIPAFAACDGVELVSVASGRVDNARSVAEAFGFEHFTADWRATVEHKDVDLVCITTPPDLHCEMAVAALDSGKHVLCEKPMALNTAEAEKMVAAANGKGLLALIDFELRFQPGRQTAREMIRRGDIGTVRHAKWNFRAPHRGDPSIPWNWWSDIKKGGGALGAINSHIIDSFNWFLDTAIVGVFCQLQTHVKHRLLEGSLREVTTDDEANMLLRFADGAFTEDATGMVSVSMVEQPDYLSRIELFGTKGAIRIDHRGELFTAKNEVAGWTPIGVDIGSSIPGAQDTGFARAFNLFAPKIIEAVRDGRTHVENAATFEDGIRVQRVLDAARESNAAGRAIIL